MTTEATARVHDLFENEYEGVLVSKDEISRLYHDDAANNRMDHELAKPTPWFHGILFRR